MRTAPSRLLQRFLAILEFAPLIAFSLAGRAGVAYAERFALGAATAIVATAALTACRWRPNPLLIAANAWLCLEALILWLGPPRLVALAATLLESAFFLVLLIVGAGFALVARHGLFAAADFGDRGARRRSLLLLMLIALAVPWSLGLRGNEQIAAVLPAFVIFTAQGLLAPRQSGAERRARR